MITNNEKISLKQLEKLMALQMFSTPIFIIFTSLAQKTNNDGWIPILISTIVAILCSFFIAKICTMFCGKSIVEILEKVFNRPISFIISILMLIKFIMYNALGIRIFGVVTKEILLPNTPIEIIIIIMLTVSFLIFAIGYEKRARLAEIMSPFIFLSLIILLILLVKEINISDVLPMFTTETKDILWQSYFSLCIFTSLDRILVLNIYIKEKKGIFKSLSKAILKVGALYIILFFFLITVLTSEEIKHHIWPITQLIKFISVPGILIERQELLFVIFWINSMFFTFSNYMFVQNIIIEKVFRRNRSYILAAFICTLVYFISIVPSNIVIVYDYINTLTINVNYITLFIIPFVIYVVAKIRKIGGKYEN